MAAAARVEGLADLELPSFGALDAPLERDGYGLPKNRLMTIPPLVEWSEAADVLDLWGVRLPGAFLRDLATAPAGRQFLLQKLPDGQLGIAVGGA